MNTKVYGFCFAFILWMATSVSAPAMMINSKGFPAPKFREGMDSDPDNRCAVKPPIGYKQHGKASFYGGYWNGRLTANGEIYNQMTMTAAHKSLPFNSRVRVRNMANNKEVVVRINNRGPYISGRIIDLSVAAANKLDMRKSGVVPVEIVVVR